MKTVIINESMLNKALLKEHILLDALPDDISSVISQHGTSLGNNPALPDIFDTPFILKIANKRFEETKKELKEIGSIDDVEEKDIVSVLARLINRCKELETPIRNELEKICFNYVIDLFGVPEESVQLMVSLVDEVDLNKDSIILDPIEGDGDDSIELNDVNDALSIRDEVYKRRLLDALCMGGAMQMSSNFESYAEDIQTLNPELLDLYRKIIALNNYQLFVKEMVGMDDENKCQMGTVEVSLGMTDEKVKIDAQGEIFPVLLSETIRGFMELFISHGLPSDKNRANAIIGKSDYLKAEPWDMRLGPFLWTLLSNTFNDINSEEMPYLLKRISSLEPKKFNFLMKEVFAQTKKGRQIMASLSNKSKNDGEYDRFLDKMDKMKKDKGIITDDFIHPDEL